MEQTKTWLKATYLKALRFFHTEMPSYSFRARLGGAAYGATACGLAGCDKRSRRPQSAFRLCF